MWASAVRCLINMKHGSWARRFNTVPVTVCIEPLDIVLLRYDNICASQAAITLCEARDLVTVVAET